MVECLRVTLKKWERPGDEATLCYAHAKAQIGVWHKHKLSIPSNFGLYISIFSGNARAHGRPEVGVVDLKWAWSGKIRVNCIDFQPRPGLFSGELGNSQLCIYGHY
jgi:hypothetical protein